MILAGRTRLERIPKHLSNTTTTTATTRRERSYKTVTSVTMAYPQSTLLSNGQPFTHLQLAEPPL